MNRWLGSLIFTAAFLSMQLASNAQDTGATISGDWEDDTIWTSGVIPGSNNNVYIGSNYPVGSASTATVTLTANESAANVYLGYGNGGSGRLDLGNQSLTISGTLYLGQNGGTGALQQGSGGSFTAQTVSLANSNTLNFGANDATSNLVLTNGSVANTVATGNVSTSVVVESGSRLNLGANLNVGDGTVVVGVSGVRSTLNMNGYSVTADDISLGSTSSPPITLENRGAFTAGALFVYNTTFDLNANDSVGSLYLNQTTTTLHSNVDYLELDNGSAATTTASGTVTGNVSVNSGSTLNLGANLNAGVTIEGQNTTFNMNGYTVSGGTVDLGYNSGFAVNLENRGVFAVSTLEVAGTTFNLNPTDSVLFFSLNHATTTLGSSVSLTALGLENGSVATTTSSGNVTGTASVGSGSTLNLGADLNVDTLTVDGNNVTLNMNGHAVSASDIFLGYSSGYSFNLENRGTLSAFELFVGNTAFDLNANDSVFVLTLLGATTTLHSSVGILELADTVATTTTAGNVTFAIDADSVSKLNLGAGLNLAGYLNIQDGSTVDAHHMDITSPLIQVGYNGVLPGSLVNTGLVQAGELDLGNASSLTLHGGDVVNNQITLVGNSILTIQQVDGIGLTFNGSANNLLIESSQLDLILTMNSQPNWVFAWSDPLGGNWISTLASMIADGQIVITVPEGYSIIDQGGVTYVAGGYVPEPPSLILGCIATVGMMALRRRLAH